MSNNLETAEQFFEACETGKGWDACKAFCHPGATFSSQTKVLAEISTLQGYCDWMVTLFTPIPDAHYDLKFFAADDARNSVAAIAVFIGTQTGLGGPTAPTGKEVRADYAYHMVFEGGRIKHVTKVWNDTISLQQLGWA